MKKPNIALVCDAINSVGGVYVETMRLSELLSKNGYKVIIISSKYPKDTDFETNHNGIKTYKFDAFPLVPISRKTLFLAYPNNKKLEKIFRKEDINVVHIMHPPTPLSWSAISSAKKMGVKIIIYSTFQPESWMVYLPKFFSRRWLSRKLVDILYFFVMRLYNRADVILCLTKFGRDVLEARGLKKKMYVISCGVDTSVFRKFDASGCCKDFGLSEKTIKLLYVGRLDHEKNVSLLVKAAKIMHKNFENFEICIVGDGLEKVPLEEMAKQSKLMDKIKFLGKVSDSDLIKMYNICDIFVLPSFIELEGIVVLEAMACGKPILIADSPDSAARFFVDGNGFLFNPENAKDLADKALILLKDDKLRRKMAAQSYKRRKEIDIRNHIKKLEKVYSDLNLN
ncbi:MAG: glycosyltransferase [archaeon]